MGGTYCFLCLTYLLLVSTFVRQGITDNFEYMLKLKDDLFRNYSVGIVPLRNQSTHVMVTMGMYVIMIQGLNMKNQVLTTSGWLKFAWRDEFLQWNPEDYGNISEIIIFQNEVWLPDVFLENTAVDRRELGNQHMLISVLNTGMVHWEPGIITDTTCAVDITKYPFDSQTCAVQFLTWMHTNKTMQVFPEGTSINLDALLPNGEWDIIATRAEPYRYPSSYRLGTDHTGVTFVLQLYRKRFFYILNTMIPVMLLSTLNVLVFILPSDCGERMALAVTVLLAFTVYLSIISETIPKTSEDTSILTIYLTLLLALSTASVVCAGIVLNIHFRDPHYPVPQFVVSVFSKFCAEKTMDVWPDSSTLYAEKPMGVWPDPSHESWVYSERRSSLWNRRLARREQMERRQSQYDYEMYNEQSKPLVRSHSLSPNARVRHLSRTHSNDDTFTKDEKIQLPTTDNKEDLDSRDDTDIGTQDSMHPNDRGTPESQTLANDTTALQNTPLANNTADLQNIALANDTAALHNTPLANDTAADPSRVQANDIADCQNTALPNNTAVRQSTVLVNDTTAAGVRKSRKRPRPGNDANKHPNEKETRSPKLEARFSEDTEDRPYYNRRATFKARKQSNTKAVVAAFTSELQKLLDDKRKQQQQSQVTWHNIGNALDRFLFWVFFFVTGSVNITIIFLLAS